MSGQLLATTQTLIQRVVGALAQREKQAEHEVSHSHDFKAFTWTDLTVNMKIVRAIFRQFLPDLGIVLLASGR